MDGKYSLDESIPSWLNLVNQFRQGYEEISALSMAERTSAFYVMCSIQMIFIAYWRDQQKHDLVQTNRDALLAIIQTREKIDLAFDVGKVD